MISTKSILRTFSSWTVGQAKAYRAGVMAAESGRAIGRDFEYDGDEDDGLDDDLTMFFFRGLADGMGDEAQGEPWFERIEDWRIAYQWWND